MIRRPTAILALLTALNFLNYLDRIILSSVLPKVQLELNLSNFDAGMLATVFLLGYFVTAPIFGALAERYSRNRLIAFGVIVWSLATAATGLAHSLPAMVIARVVCGIGEASFVTLAPTIIDDITPPHKKGRALAIFYLAVPMGSALGYLTGGYVESLYGWRAAFFVAGGPGVVLAVTCLMIAEPARKLAAVRIKIAESVRILSKIPQWKRTVFGYIAHTATLGAFSYWAPKFLFTRYALDLKVANFKFGVITVVAGAIGTMVGGQWADRAQAKLPGGNTSDEKHTTAATRARVNILLKVCAVGVAIAAPFSAAAFLSPGSNMFFAFVFVAEFGVFLSTSPISAALLRSVPAHMRASAMALSIFAIHIFGDLWSPPVLGLLADHLPIVLAMMALPIGLGVAAYLWWPRAREALAD